MIPSDPVVGSFTFKPVGPFSLAAVVGFLSHVREATAVRTDEGGLDLAFVADHDWVPIGVELGQRGPAVNGRFTGPARAEDVRRQVQRILSLDVDARPFPALARRDPVVAEVQSRYPGLRPLCFWSPYEAAVWAVLADGMTSAKAVAIRNRLSVDLGPEVAVFGRRMHAFPSPQRLVTLERFPGLTDVQHEHLRAVAGAALGRKLDGDRLRDLPRSEALAALRRIPGIGPTGAELVLTRGAGETDAPADLGDKRLRTAIIRAYDLEPDAAAEDLVAIVDGWRPFRSWVAFLLLTWARAGDLPSQRPASGPRGV